MHSRRRSPGGGGIRSNSMGMGSLGATRISPEAPLPRNLGYNRSFGGRMPPPKPYLAPQPLPPRRGDILMEAGRLATEYLVSKGVLPPNVLSEKWANGSFSKNNQIMEFQMAADGRPSALARLGNGVHDGGSRNRTRGRRRMGSNRYFDYDWNRDNRKNDFFPDRAQTSTDMEYEDDFGYGFGQLGHEERRGDLDFSGGGDSKAIVNDLPLKSDIVGYSEPLVHNYELPVEAGLKASVSTAGTELPMVTDCEASKASNEMKISSMEIGEVKESTSNDGLEKQSDLEDFPMDHLPMEGEILNKNLNDLLSLCSFAKVPTRARSSLTVKGSKGETPPMTKEETICDISPLEGPNVSREEDPSESTFANQTQNSKCLDSDVSTALSIQTVEDVGASVSVLAVEKVECMIHEQASEQGFSEIRICNSVLKDRGDKRDLEDDDMRESKKPREWTSTAVACADEYLPFHNFSANLSHSHMNPALDVEVVEIVDQERLFDVSLLPRGTSESGIESKEEKQLFPGSFKICDLNLMESSDTTGTHDSDPVYGLPSTMEAKNGLQVDVDLTISSSCNRTDDYGGGSADAKETVIEVEDDSAKEDEDFDNSERKTEIVHSSLESFPDHMVSTGDLPDAQDGYGLMISELLGNDISSCSSVPADITSLHTEMGLHNGAEILDDDDPIYLSLGEIPISFLAWEQPPQPFEKPF